MRLLWKTLLGVMTAILLVIIAAVLCQVYYALTPVTLSPLVKSLDAKASALDRITDNGHRAYGIRAPAGIDPVLYGKCLLAAHEKMVNERSAQEPTPPSPFSQVEFSAYSRRWADREDEIRKVCRGGLDELSVPPVAPTVRVTPSTSADEWSALHAAAPHDILRQRADLIWAAGPRRTGLSVEAPLPPYDTLMKVLRWQTADARQLWIDGDVGRASGIYHRLLNATASRSGDSLIDAMISVAAQSQLLLSVQSNVAASQGLDAGVAEQLVAALQVVDSTPDRLDSLMDIEWAVVRAVWDVVRASPCQSLAFGAAPSWSEQAVCKFTEWTIDHNDTINLAASANRAAQQALQRAARAEPELLRDKETDPFACGRLDWLGPMCLPFVRNPMGRIVAGISAPMYAQYGTRIADLRNLAAATRLAITARTKGVAKADLAAFIAAAEPDQRDVFTGQPFAFDAAGGRLRVQLRTPSTVLGQESYELPL